MPGAEFIVHPILNIPVKPAQIVPVIPVAGAFVIAVAGADNPAAGHIAGAPGPANPAGPGGQQLLPFGHLGVAALSASPVRVMVFVGQLSVQPVAAWD